MASYEHAGVKQLSRLLDGVMVVASELSLPVVLQRIAETAADLVDARYAALGVLDDSRTRLAQFITVGIDEAAADQIGRIPQGHGILGLLIVNPKPLRLPDLTVHPDSYGFPPQHPPMKSFLGVPILLRNEVFGNLYLTDKADGKAFTDVDEELVVALAAAAGLAIENARLHEHLSTMTLLQERERIARDLHDDVIQRVFAAGLALQSTAQLVRDPAVVERLERTVKDLDVTIAQVRNAIFQLSHRPPTGGRSLRSDAAAMCSEFAATLGFDPVCDVRGPVDSAVTDPVAEHALLSLREMLSNVARHAQATSVSVTVAADDDELRLEVDDDGVGVADDSVGAGHGLINLRERAASLGGTFTIERATDGGTVASWRVPLDG